MDKKYYIGDADSPEDENDRITISCNDHGGCVVVYGETMAEAITRVIPILNALNAE
jgi:hypothetical protein